MDKMGGLRFYTYPVPEAQEQDLDGQRSIVDVIKEKGEGKPVGTEPPADDVIEGSSVAGSNGQELGRAEVGIRELRKMEEEARELGRAEVGIRELRKMEVEPR